MQLRRSVMNARGFSLIELLIATMLISVSMLALLTTMLTAMKANRSNEIRNTAIIVANHTAEALLALSMDDPELSQTTHTRLANNQTQSNKGLPEVQQNIRGYQFNYIIQWTVKDRSGELKEVDIVVRYKLKTTDPDYLNYSSVIYKHERI